jgi:hypothetical protein
MKAGNHHNPIFLHLEEYSVGEAPHSRAPASTVNGWELQWMFRYRLYRGLNRLSETRPKLRANVVVPFPRFQQIIISF